MGIEIKIRQPENKIDIYRIEELWKNACTNVFEGETNPRIGVQDNFYRMQLQFINRLAHKPLSPEEMTAFVQRSNEIMMLLTK